MSKIARIPVSDRPMGWPGFASWLRVTHPPLYRAVGARMMREGPMAGLGLVGPQADPVAVAAATPSMWDKLSATVRDLLPQAVQVYTQKKIFDAQIRRAENGQAPLDTAALADASSIKVGVDANTRNTALWIGGGIAVALFLPKLLRG